MDQASRGYEPTSEALELFQDFAHDEIMGAVDACTGIFHTELLGNYEDFHCEMVFIEVSTGVDGVLAVEPLLGFKDTVCD